METEEILVKIGENIKKIRAEKKLKQQELADACNFEVSAMSRIENGHTNLRISTINKIAIALNINLRDLLP